jgi:hypothetical protein
MLTEDRRAREILLDMHWSSTGWRSPRLQPSTDDYNHALRAGYLFQPVELKTSAVAARLRLDPAPDRLRRQL